MADGRLDEVFPAGSAARPLLLVGREPQIERLNGLGAELLADSGSAKHNRIAVALHGPRGVGKTVLLDTFANAMLKRGAMVIADVGNTLSSEERLVRFIQNKIAPGPEVTKTLRGKAGLDGFGRWRGHDLESRRRQAGSGLREGRARSSDGQPWWPQAQTNLDPRLTKRTFATRARWVIC